MSSTRSPHGIHRGADRPRRRQRHRGHPRRLQHRRRRGDPHRRRQRRRHLHLGLREGRPARRSTSSTRRPRRSQWNGETDLRLVDRGRPGGDRVGANGGRTRLGAMDLDPPARRSERGTTRSGPSSASSRRTGAEPVHARRAGRAAVHGQDRRDGAVDRRQVLRLHPGDGRGPPRRGVRQVPRHQAVGPLPDQRPPQAAARRHHHRQPLGHDLPGHADHGRGPGPGRLRLHAPAHRRSRCSSSCCAT